MEARTWKIIAVTIVGLLALATLLTFVQSASATPISSCGEHQQCIEFEISNIAGLVSAGNAISKILMPHAGHVGDTTGISNAISIPGVTGTPTATYTLATLVGCTSGTATTQQTLTSTYNTFMYEVSLLMTDTTCTGTLRIVITAGTLGTTEIVDILHRFVVVAEGDIESFNKECQQTSFWSSTCVASDFEVLVGSTVWEFFALITLLIIAVIVWNRSGDYVVRFSMMAVTFIPGIIWIQLYLVNGWQGLLLIAVLTFIMGLYLGFRTVWDALTERKADRENQS